MTLCASFQSSGTTRLAHLAFEACRHLLAAAGGQQMTQLPEMARLGIGASALPGFVSLPAAIRSVRTVIEAFNFPHVC